MSPCLLAYRWEHVLNQETLYEFSKPVVDYLKAHRLYSSSVEEQVRAVGSLQGVVSVPASVKKLFKTALEIPYQYHLKHQQVFQRYTDNAVSKTINLLRKARVEDISTIYYMAWHWG